MLGRHHCTFVRSSEAGIRGSACAALPSYRRGSSSTMCVSHPNARPVTCPASAYPSCPPSGSLGSRRARGGRSRQPCLLRSDSSVRAGRRHAPAERLGRSQALAQHRRRRECLLLPALELMVSRCVSLPSQRLRSRPLPHDLGSLSPPHEPPRTLELKIPFSFLHPHAVHVYAVHAICEATINSALLLHISNSGAAWVRAMKSGSGAFDVDDFVACLITYMGGWKARVPHNITFCQSLHSSCM